MRKITHSTKKKGVEDGVQWGYEGAKKIYVSQIYLFIVINHMSMHMLSHLIVICYFYLTSIFQEDFEALRSPAMLQGELFDELSFYQQVYTFVNINCCI